MKKFISMFLLANVMTAAPHLMAQETKQSQCEEYGSYSDAEGIWHVCESADSSGMDDYSEPNEGAQADAQLEEEDIE